MTTSPPSSHLGAFRDATPGGIPLRPGEAAWASATLNGLFYLAAAGLDSLSIQRYLPSTGKWDTVFQKNTTPRKRGSRTEQPVLPELRMVTAPGPHGASTLFLRVTTATATEFLRSDPSGGSFDAVTSVQPDVIAAFPEPPPPPEPGPGLPPSATFAGVLPFGADRATAWSDRIRGCSLWGSTGPLISRGAHRFSANPEILAWSDSAAGLILVLGDSQPPPAGKTAAGFEIVRLYPDGSWDLLVGTPRVTDQGLKVPLSCLGPGMNTFEPSRWCFLAKREEHLLLGTYDDLAGFRVWRSADGIEWSAGEAELVGIDHVLGAECVILPGGIALLLELNSPTQGHTRAVWMGS